MIGIFIIHFFALITPGPDFFLVSRTGLSENKAAICKVAFGITLGVMVWAVVSLFGLHVILSYYPVLNRLILVAGALYLLYLAYAIYKQAGMPLEETPTDNRRYFLNGLITNLSDPKAAIYFSSIFSLFPFKYDEIDTISCLLLLLFFETIIWSVFIGFILSIKNAKLFYKKIKGRLILYHQRFLSFMLKIIS